MALTWAHKTTKNSNDTNATGSITPTASSLLIASVVYNANVDPTWGGTLGGSWTLIGTRRYNDNGNGASVAMYYNTTYGSSGTVQITGTGVTWTAIALDTVIDSVPFASNPVKQAASGASGNGTSPLDGVSLSTAPTNGTFAMAGTFDQTLSANTGWTALTTSDSSWTSIATERASTGVQGASWTHSGSSAGVMTIFELAYPSTGNHTGGSLVRIAWRR